MSNDDREPPEESIADSLKEKVSSNYSAYIPALEASQTINDKVVRDIVERWPERQSGIPHTP